MKKFIHKAALLAALALGAQETSAQFYAGATVGYGFATTNDVLGIDQNTNSSAQTTQTNIYGTYGGGVTGQINLGYYFNPHFRFDLGAYYLAGSTYLATKTVTPSSEFTREVKTSQFRLQPSIIVQTGHGKVQPFARFGLVAPLGGQTTRTDVTTLPSLSTTTTNVTVLKGAPSLGFVAGGGVAYELNENMMLTGELVYTGLRVKTKSAELTKSETVTPTTTTDNLPNTVTFSKEYNFVDELTSSSNSLVTNPAPDVSKAQDLLASRVNFSAISIQIGFVYKFGATSEE